MPSPSKHQEATSRVSFRSSVSQVRVEVMDDQSQRTSRHIKGTGILYFRWISDSGLIGEFGDL